MKEQFAKGLFIRNDEEGHPCRVGDIVEVTYDSWQFNDFTEEWVFHGEISSMGILCLLKSRGIQIRQFNGCYIKPNLTNLGRKWKWKLIESK
jgi:hypothetical protein